MLSGNNSVDIEYQNYSLITDTETLHSNGQKLFDYVNAGVPLSSFCQSSVPGMKCIFVPRTSITSTTFFRPLWALPKSLLFNGLKMSYDGSYSGSRAIVSTNSTQGGTNSKLYYWSTGGWSYRNDMISNSAMGYLDVVSDNLVAAAEAFISYFAPNVELVSNPTGVVTITKVSGDIIGDSFTYRVTAGSDLYSGISVSVGDLVTTEGVSDVVVTASYSNVDYELTFTMPINGVRIVATPQKKSFTISYNSSQYGTASGVSTSVWGNNVIVTVSPNAGYTVAGLTVRQGTTDIEVTRLNDTQFRFVMPSGNVTVTPSFNDILSVVWQVIPTSLGSVTVNGITEYRKATDAPTSWTQIASGGGESLTIYTSSDVMWGKVGNSVYFASRSQFTIYERLVIDGYTYNHQVTPTNIDSSTGVNLYNGSLYLQYNSITNLPLTFTSKENFIQAAANRIVNGVVKAFDAGSTVTFTVEPLASFRVNKVSGNADNLEISFDKNTNTGSFIMPSIDTDVLVYIGFEGDPNQQGGNSESEIPIGSFDEASDNILMPPMPSSGICYDVVAGQGTGKGIVTVYNPSLAELKDLGDYLYSNSVTEALWNGLRNIFSNPMDAIVSLHVLPFTPVRGSNKHAIGLGPLVTNVNSYIVKQQYQDVNMGTLRFQPFWDSYLDYSPYTKITLFLPYIGSVELNPDMVMGKLIGIKYRCDILTGGCVAYLFTYESSNGNTYESLFGEYSGSMALALPLSGSDFSQMISGFISAVSSVAIMKGVGTGALVTNANESVEQARQQLAIAHAARGEAYAIPKTIRGANGRFASNAEIRNEAINSANSAYENAKDALQMARGQQRGVTALAGATHMATVPYTVGRVMGSKINTTISGTITGGLGLLGSQKPYVIITRPRQSLAESYNHFVGYPSNITAKLNTLEGYTKVEQVELKNVPCTDTELAMLYEALKEGSYI